MMIQDIEFTLKDGRTALLRSPRAEDVQGTLEYLYQSAGETEFILRYPEECGNYTPEGEKELFERDNRSDNTAMIMCLVEGKIVGNCMIRWSNGIKTRHRAQVAIALLRDYWNQGIGTRMFREMIRIAEENETFCRWSWILSRGIRGPGRCMKRWASGSPASGRTQSV